MDDRLYILTHCSSDSDDDLPQIQGVQLIREGPDRGLYQITVPGYDGAPIALGRSAEIERACEVHDMVAIGLYGHESCLNFYPSRYHVEAYLNVLLTFRKLFPGYHFWNAVKRGLNAGIVIDAESLRTNPLLNSFFNYVQRSRSNWNQRSMTQWPPFCPPWMLPRHGFEIKSSPIDALATVQKTKESDTTSSCDDRSLDRKGRMYRVPKNGVVTHRVLDAFVPPDLVVHEDNELPPRTRRGRSVKQPVRFREDVQMDLSDSESLEAKRPKVDEALSGTGMNSAPNSQTDISYASKIKDSMSMLPSMSQYVTSKR